jgi:hypothetical protein
MKEYLRLFAKTGIALFCVWHMTAIAVFSLPTDANDRVTQWIRYNTASAFSPYVFQTSQWQQWNLFAPNPLRRIVFYRIDTKTQDGDWMRVTTIDSTTYGLWRHTTRFKLLSLAIEEQTRRPALTERAAQVLCTEYGFIPGERIRIWHEIAIVPSITPSPNKTWWDSWIPQFEQTLAIDTVCQS